MAGATTQASRLTEPHFRALAQTAPDAIVTASADGRIAYVNPAAERLFGRPAHELIGSPVTALMPEDLRTAHGDGFARFVATGRGSVVGTTVEVVAVDAAGRRIPVELSLGSSGAGADRTLTAIIRDLRTRRRREQVLAAQLAVTRVLAGPLPAEEAAPLTVEALVRSLGWDLGLLWMVGDDGRPHLRHLWQADRTVTGELAGALTAAGDRTDAGLAGEALRAGTPIFLEGFAGRDDGGSSPAGLAARAGLRSAVCLPLMSDGRGRGAIECWSRDDAPVGDDVRNLLGSVANQIGEHLQRLQVQERLERTQRELAAELRRSNEELERFAFVAAHDLRSPLVTIAGFADLLLREPGSVALDLPEIADRIGRTARGCGRLLDSLLGYARVEAGELAPVRLETEAVLGEVLEWLTADIEQRRARIVVGALPAVTADREQLGVLLQNLLANALKFSGDAPPLIDVRGRREGPDAHLVVADDGIGLDPDDAARLFGMFRRGSGGAGTDGAGIGLATCAKVVERHGGRIWVEPGRERGTAFHVLLPSA